MIALGCDHGGFELKEAIRRHLEDNQVEYRDFGIYENKSVDYPEIANIVSHAVADFPPNIPGSTTTPMSCAWADECWEKGWRWNWWMYF